MKTCFSRARETSAHKLASNRLAGTVLTVAAGAALAARAAPPRAATARALPTLSFDMTARFAMKETADDSLTPDQTVTARVYIDGRRIRAESQVGDRLIVYLFAPPFGYKLLPNSKTGLRYHVSASYKFGKSSSFDPQSLLPLLQNPGELRAALHKQGGQQTGTSQLNGTPVNIYTGNKLQGQPVKVKAWLRQSDALPARLELASRKLTVVASWRNYQHGRPIANALFAVPAGYHLRDAHDAANDQ